MLQQHLSDRQVCCPLMRVLCGKFDGNRKLLTVFRDLKFCEIIHNLKSCHLYINYSNTFNNAHLLQTLSVTGICDQQQCVKTSERDSYLRGIRPSKLTINHFLSVVDILFHFIYRLSSTRVLTRKITFDISNQEIS